MRAPYCSLASSSPICALLLASSAAVFERRNWGCRCLCAAQSSFLPWEGLWVGQAGGMLLVIERGLSYLENKFNGRMLLFIVYVVSRGVVIHQIDVSRCIAIHYTSDVS